MKRLLIVALAAVLALPGLAVAQDLANRHGGLIEFDSRPGRTIFTLLLPIDGETHG